MPWLFFAFSGPVLWAISVHLDKYLVERFFKDSNVAVLLVFTAFMGVVMLPFIWYFDPAVVRLDIKGIAIIGASGLLYMGGMLFYLRALQSEEASVVAPFFQARLIKIIFQLLATTSCSLSRSATSDSTPCAQSSVVA